MKGLYSSLDDKIPTWTLGESRIGENPGMGFRPLNQKLTQGSLIWYDSKNQTAAKEYADMLTKFLERKLAFIFYYIILIFVATA